MCPPSQIVNYRHGVARYSPNIEYSRYFYVYCDIVKKEV